MTATISAHLLCDPELDLAASVFQPPTRARTMTGEVEQDQEAAS